MWYRNKSSLSSTWIWCSFCNGDGPSGATPNSGGICASFVAAGVTAFVTVPDVVGADVLDIDITGVIVTNPVLGPFWVAVVVPDVVSTNALAELAIVDPCCCLVSTFVIPEGWIPWFDVICNCSVLDDIVFSRAFRLITSWAIVLSVDIWSFDDDTPVVVVAVVVVVDTNAWCCCLLGIFFTTVDVGPFTKCDAVWWAGGVKSDGEALKI